MSKNPLIMVVGKSACGKSTLVERACKELGLKAIPSYTTRKPRFENEEGHTFITNDEYDCLENKVAENTFCGNRYCVTAEQADDPQYSLYVVDCAGIKAFKENYQGNRDVYTIQIACDEKIRVERLKHRYSKVCENETEMLRMVIDRLVSDSEEFRDIDDITTYYIDNSFSVDSSYDKFKKLIMTFIGEDKDV